MNEKDQAMFDAWRAERAERAGAAYAEVAGCTDAPLRLRPEVLAFAALMERELRANDHRPGWKGARSSRMPRRDLPTLLANRVEREAADLARATAVFATGPGRPPWSAAHVAAIAKEAADVANMAMMVADVCGALPAAFDLACGGPR